MQGLGFRVGVQGFLDHGFCYLSLFETFKNRPFGLRSFGYIKSQPERH